MSACNHCGVRWAQREGLCRTCDRASGAFAQRAFAELRERLAIEDESVVRVPLRAIAIDGVDYDVMWDGSR